MSRNTLIEATLNGEQVEFLCEPRQSLLECLRDIVGLTGSKEGCNDGNCGACGQLRNPSRWGLTRGWLWGGRKGC